MTKDAPEADLYALPLDEFIAARDELAARLKKEGDGEGAARVKALRKPSVAAWAVNQLARRHADSMAKLLALRDEMEGAGAAQLRAVGEKRKRLLADLVKRAEKVLADGGHGSSAATLEKVTQTLQAGATDEEIELLREGRLTRELSPSGFAGFGFAPASPAEAEPSAPSKATERARAKAEELAAAAEEKERAARELEKAAEVARKHAEAAAREAEVARRNADRARERAEAAAAKLD